MSTKKILAILLVMALLVTVFAGCGTSDSSTPSSQGESSTAAEDGSEESTSASSGDYPTISLMMICGAIPADSAKVAEALSEITREKIGCNVEFIHIEIGNWATQLNLLLSGGDNTLDVYWAGGPIAYSTVIANGQAMDLADLLAPYADEMKATLGENVYDSGYVNGQLFGVGRLLDQASTPVYNLRADVAAEFGYSNGDKISLEILTDLFKQIREKYPDTPLIGPMNGGVNLGDSRFDSLGNAQMLGVLGDFGQSTEVVNYYESAEYAQNVEYIKQWKELGAFMPDFLNVTEAPVDYIPAGKALGCFASHFSAEMNGIWASNNYGTEIASLQIYEDAVAVTPGAYYCVNPATKNAEEAAKLIYLMATDADVINLLINGIENEHYQVDGDGVAHFLDGQDVSTVGWSTGYSWTALNSTLSYPFEYPADYYSLMIEANKTAYQSKAFGCQFDLTSVSDAISACTNVVNQYRPSIESGSAGDIDATFAEFKQALKDAGIDEIIAERQVQIDAFVAGN